LTGVIRIGLSAEALVLDALSLTDTPLNRRNSQKYLRTGSAI
jgi:hypothetical protein